MAPNSLLKRSVFIAGFPLVTFLGWLCLAPRSEMARRVHQLADVLAASKLYSLEHSGRMAGGFDQLASLRREWDGHVFYGEPTGDFLQRAARELEFVSKDATDKSDSSLVLVRERNPDSEGRRAIGYVDMATRVVREGR